MRIPKIVWYFFYVLFIGSSATLYYLRQERLSIGIVLLLVVMGFFDLFRKKHIEGEIVEVGCYEWSFVNKENREERIPMRSVDVLHNVYLFQNTWRKRVTEMFTLQVRQVKERQH